MATFCSTALSNWALRAAWPAGSNGSTSTILALGRSLGIATVVRNLAAVSASTTGQVEAIIFCICGSLDQVHEEPGSTTIAARPSGLCAVYLIAGPPA